MDLEYVRPTRTEIDINNLRHNIKEIRNITSSDTRLCAVVKADGYGHGAFTVAKVALEEGASYLAVALFEEAMELREKGIKAPILILGFTPPEQFDKIIKKNITQTVYDLNMAHILSEKAQNIGKKAKIHIKLDTGMGRIGFLAEKSSISKIQEIFKLEGLEVEGLFTHFSKADEKDKSYTIKQFESFMKISQELTRLGYHIPIKHVANSAAIIDFPEAHLDMIRPGIILYGLYPSDEVDKTRLDLKPVMSLKTKISHIKILPRGRCISYGGIFVTKRESKIATLPIGYGDGFCRCFSKAYGQIKGEKAPIVGRICMDQCMMDITDIKSDVKIGDDVMLFGPGAMSVDDLAKIAGTINYEIVCGISKRVPRVEIFW